MREDTKSMTLHCDEDVSRAGWTHIVGVRNPRSQAYYSVVVLANCEILLLLEMLDLSLTWNYNKQVHMTCFSHIDMRQMQHIPLHLSMNLIQATITCLPKCTLPKIFCGICNSVPLLESLFILQP